MLNVTKILADYAVKAKYEDFPERVINWTKLLILDSLGCALGGSVTKPGKVLTKVVRDLGGEPESTIIGDGSKVACHEAALVNSYLADVLDFEDTYTAIGHPGANIIPPALAVGERERVSGKGFITSVVVGHEVSIRIGLALTPSRGVLSDVVGFACWQMFGAIAAAGNILGLDPDEMVEAFGIGGAGAPVPAGNKWGWEDRPLCWLKQNFGEASRVGVFAALLRQQGFRGRRTILEDTKHPMLNTQGFWRIIGSDRCDFDQMVKGLGKEYEIMNESLKPYSSCRLTHTTIEAVKAIMDSRNVTPEGIKKIIVKGPEFLKAFFGDYRPSSCIDGEFSIPYTVAMAALGGKPGPNWYTNEKLTNPKVLALADKVEIMIDPKIDKLWRNNLIPSLVQITTQDGKTFSKLIEYPLWSPQRPATRDEVENKFRNLASFVLENEQIENIVQKVRKLEEVSDVSELAEQLSVQKPVLRRD